MAAAVSTLGLAIAGGGCLHAGDDERLTRRTMGEQTADAWIDENGLPEEARRGAEFFAQIGCLTCHTYLGAGIQNLGAPDLTAIGAKPRRDERYFARYIRDPREFGNPVMPRYDVLSDAQVDALAFFLESSRGAGG